MKSLRQLICFIGCFIIGLAGPNAIKLKLPRSLQIHPVVNISRVKPYLGPMEGQTPYWPGPVHMTEDRDNKWEVDHIVDSRLKNKKLKYLVHWRGYDDSDCTWEPKSNLGNTKDAIHDFHKSHSSTPQVLSIDPAVLITWKSIFRRGVVLWSHLRDHTFNGLNQFFSFHLI